MPLHERPAQARSHFPSQPDARVATEEVSHYERAPISAATREWLLAFAVGDPAQPAPGAVPDWTELFREVRRNHLVGLTHRYLTHGADGGAVPAGFVQWVRGADHANKLHLLVVSEMMWDILAQFDEAGVEWLVLKGPAVAHMLYPDPSLRTFNDLDVAVHERDWGTVYRLMDGLGYLPVRPHPTPPPRLVPAAALYHAQYHHRSTGMSVEVHVDDLLQTGLGVRDLDGMWKRSVVLPGPRGGMRTLSYEDQLITLAAHAHYHGLERLKWLADLVFLMRDHGDRLDWERILASVRQEEVQVGVYYGLVYLARLTGIEPPDGVPAALRPDPFRRWLHERLMPDAEVLSLQPMWRPMFSFYPTPLFGRLLPDLLVMGRRADKVRYLARMVVPPKEWLCHYYELEPSRWSWVQRLLHPFKLAIRLAAEVITPARFRLRERPPKVQE
jgi:hypothetical protein